MKKIKAVIPAAGFGTRFLPLTKAQPKEMLPVVNKPTIQWVIEEAVDAGITEIAIITGTHKQAIENHFKPIEKLEKALEKAGKIKELGEIRKVNELANLEFIIQEEQKGLGHAILCAEDFVGDNPFAVLLGDTICTGNPNCTKGLVDIFTNKKASIFSVEEIKPEETHRYGIVSGKEIERGLMLVDDLVEKPDSKEAPSLLGIQGRYIFTPDLFDYQRSIKRGAGGEIQLTDAIRLMLSDYPVAGYLYEGKKFDCGSKEGYVNAITYLAKDILDN